MNPYPKLYSCLGCRFGILFTPGKMRVRKCSVCGSIMELVEIGDGEYKIKKVKSE